MGYLIAGMVDAHLAWAKDRLADDAIRATKEFIGRLDIKGLTRYMGWLWSTQPIKRVLTREATPPCDQHLFDWFLWYGMPLSSGTTRLASTDVPGLLLYHPINPDPRPWSRIAHTYLERPQGHFISKITKQTKLAYVAHIVLRAAYILKLYGEEEESAFLTAFVGDNDKFRHVWHNRQKVEARLTCDPKLQRLKDRIHAHGGPRRGLLEEMVGEDFALIIENREGGTVRLHYA